MSNNTPLVVVLGTWLGTTDALLVPPPWLKVFWLTAVTDSWFGGCTDRKVALDNDSFNASFELSGRLGVEKTDCWMDAPFVLGNGWFPGKHGLNMLFQGDV